MNTVKNQCGKTSTNKRIINEDYCLLSIGLKVGGQVDIIVSLVNVGVRKFYIVKLLLSLLILSRSFVWRFLDRE